ncbi:STAS domain-containing protein [Alicycliphilus denitrificans]|uniref:STAS domain-containing protein n=1 Tax=Alicycliphilus denitrificans TaxID=179636 RepID=A0A420KCD6_9BURK|nr:STAS domain-containing protein [Alicycliphilus denitrificans]RKJ96794.1 STAS domain-containing protein [Alicycliphilus denitrificans]
MSKDDTAPGGLLSKMVKFVRNPTVSWSDLDAIDADRESQYSRQMLKEMIERKRRNDFVRRREFDQLRKLRQREAQQGRRLDDALARASFFQTSMTSPGERAVTLKKIDEIEAQMSQQWWRGTRQGDASAPAAAAPEPTAPAAPLQPPAVAQPAPVPPLGAGALHANPDHAFAPTAPLSMPAMLGGAVSAGQLIAGGGALGAAAWGDGAGAGQAAVPVAEPFVHEPDLEEAAIRFASGDYAQAESALKEVLAQHRQDEPRQQHDIWMTLFDLYRATGQQEPFDMLSIDYAARFGRSAPLWFSLPEKLGLQAAQEQPGQPGAAPHELSWNAPPTLTQQSVAALQASLARSAPPWTMNWSRLAEVELSAVPALVQQFEDWAGRDGQIRFVGVQALQALLHAYTPSGDREADPQWWRLRMAALRLMGQPDEFELVALDYCVTYEVSPPSWVPPRCGYSGDDGVQPAQGLDMADSAPFLSSFGPSQPPQAQEGPVAVLEGHIEGDATPALESLQAMARPGAPLTVNCERLVRIDFAAVGSVLNWAAAQQAQGQAVQFTHLHRLVAVLFNVIGINEHAWVVPRAN